MPDSTPSNEHAPETQRADEGEHHAPRRITTTLRKPLKRILLLETPFETWRDRLATSICISFLWMTYFTIASALRGLNAGLNLNEIGSSLRLFAEFVIFFFVILSVMRLFQVWLIMERNAKRNPLVCEHCQYDLQGLPAEAPCPECGTARAQPEATA